MLSLGKLLLSFIAHLQMPIASLITERIAKDKECLDNRLNDKKDYIVVGGCGIGS